MSRTIRYIIFVLVGISLALAGNGIWAVSQSKIEGTAAGDVGAPAKIKQYYERPRQLKAPEKTVRVGVVSRTTLDVSPWADQLLGNNSYWYADIWTMDDNQLRQITYRSNLRARETAERVRVGDFVAITWTDSQPRSGETSYEDDSDKVDITVLHKNAVSGIPNDK